MILSLAWRNLWRHSRRTLLTTTSMAVSISVCIVMSGFMEGFMETLRAAVVDRQLGHVQIHHPDYPTSASPYDTVADADAVLGRLKALPGIDRVAARIQGFALFGGAGIEASTGMFMGVDPVAEAALTGMDERIVDGAWLAPDSPGVVIGERLAQSLDLGVGQDLLVVTNALDGSIGNRLYPVLGVYRTANITVDEGAVLPLAAAQELLVLEDAIHEIVVVTTDFETIEDTAPAIAAAAPDLAVRPWWEVSPETVQMLGMSGVSNVIFAVLILGIAAFITVNTLLMSVYERTRELGVLAAIGTRPRQLVLLVLTESGLLALLSGALGLALGLAGDLALARWGVRLDVGDGQGFTIAGVSLDPVIHAVITPDGLLVPLFVVGVVGVLGGLWPALRAARLDPVAAIRQE